MFEKMKSAPACTAGAVDVTGCRFSLYPMCDNFVSQIMSTVAQVDTTKVWSATDHLSTVYRGKQAQVMDCARAAFVCARKKEIHMVGEFTFSRGCPGDTNADHFLKIDDVLNNQKAATRGEFLTYAKISFYVFGVTDYMESIRYVVELAQMRGLKPKSAHYVTMLEGSAASLFAFFDEVLTYARQHLSHYVLEATLSVESPSLGRQVSSQEVKR